MMQTYIYSIISLQCHMILNADFLLKKHFLLLSLL